MLARIALLAAVAALLLALYWNGFFEFIADGQRVRASVESAGIWAPVVYVAAFALLEPFFVPGVVFMIPGALIWGYAQLVWLSWLGAIGAGIVGFGFARFIGRDWVAKRLPPRLRRFDERLVTRGLRTVIGIRLTLFLAPPAHWLLGLSQVRFSAFVLGTAIGFLPGIALLAYVVVFLDETLGEFFGSLPGWFWLMLAIGTLVALRARRRFRLRRARAAEAPRTSRALRAGSSPTASGDPPGRR